jgi:riboflavin synthase
MGKIVGVDRNPFGARLLVDRSGWTPPGGYEPGRGDSICVSGVCLTVTEARGSTLAFDVIAETLAKTTLGELAVGSEVNLEPPVTAQQPLGGHFMQGHVDAVGTVVSVYRGADACRVTVEPPAELMDYIVPKGSVAIDGVSLTVANVTAHAFDVALIPTTLDLTTLGRAEVGDKVNLETDIISKTIVNWLRRQGQSAPSVTMETLRRAGFI